MTHPRNHLPLNLTSIEYYYHYNHLHHYHLLSPLSPSSPPYYHLVHLSYRSQASGRRDGVAKALYERLFNTIVHQINRALDPSLPSLVSVDNISASSQRQAQDADNEILSIGILDIYGRFLQFYTKKHHTLI